MNSPSFHRSRLAAALAFAALGVLGCTESATRTGGPAGPSEATGTPNLSLITGSGFQTAITDETLFPIRVKVVDGTGRPLRSVWVSYDVVVGEGAFTADSTFTNELGVTQVSFLPLSVGTVVARAKINLPTGSSEEMVTFHVLNDPDLATGFQRVGGDDQSGTVGSILAQPFVVRITNPDGLPVDNFPVSFATMSADSVAGMVDLEDEETVEQVTVLTDSDGFAKAFMRLGSSPGVYSAKATALFGSGGSQTLQSATFSATAILSERAATRLLAIAGDRQTVTIGFSDSLDPTIFIPFAEPEQPNPLGVQAVDRFGNPVPGVQVLWNVTDGGGKMFSSITFTDQNGITLNTVTDVSLGRNLIDAVSATTNRVTFVIEGVSSQEGQEERPEPGESGPGKEGSGGTPIN